MGRKIKACRGTQLASPSIAAVKGGARKTQENWDSNFSRVLKIEYDIIKRYDIVRRPQNLKKHKKIWRFEINIKSTRNILFVTFLHYLNFIIDLC